MHDEGSIMPEPIQHPLWELMLSTNDCSPGCACEDDHFQMTLPRVRQWIEATEKQDVESAKCQLEALLSVDESRVEDFSNQTNLYFSSHRDLIEWLEDWLRLMNGEKALHQ